MSLVITPLGERGTGERVRGHYEDGLVTGLDAAWAAPSPGPTPAWRKSNGKGYAEPMLVDVSGPRSQYANLAAKPRNSTRAKVTRMRAWVPREWNEIRRPENAAWDCRAFTAPPDVERTHVFEAQPPPGDAHPSALCGWIDVHVGAPPRHYEVSVRSTSGGPSRAYVLLAPTAPVHFGPAGPAALLVCLGRSPDRLSRADSEASSCGTPVVLDG